MPLRDVDSYNKRLTMLTTEKSSLMEYWRDLADTHLAHRGKFLNGTSSKKGHKRNTKQPNNTSRLAARTLASGMMAGITSPARPWFRLATSDPILTEIEEVRLWLNDCEVIMREVFSSSNLYNSLHMLYSELGVFGTASMGVYEDFENVIWCKPYTIGSYSLATNGRNEVDTQYREYQYTVAQTVDEFGLDNCSTRIKEMWKKGNTEALINIVHIIEPNTDRDNISPLAKHKRFRSVYYEKSTSRQESKQFLRESGFDEFPILAPRWDVSGEDVYASDCPGMTAIGDAKSLQLAERRGAQAVDKVVTPPMQAPSSLRNKLSQSSLVSGAITFVEDTSAGGVKSMYDFRPDINAMEARIDKYENRIQRTFYEDLFLMLANSDRRQITAREISERHEEKLLMLGPVLERLHNELLDPLIDITFAILQRKGILPVPPEVIRDTNLKVEYVSVLAQAQRMVAVTAIERTAAFAGELSAIWPEARHKFNAQQAVDEFSSAMGVSPRIINSDDDVEEIEAVEAQAAMEAQQAEQMAQTVDVASQASQMPTDQETVLTDVMKAAGLQ